MTSPVPEFSRSIAADRIPAAGLDQTLTAKPAERAALAKRFDLLELKRLTATVTLTHAAGQAVKVTGTIEADIVQACVVTLEPIATHFNLKLDLLFIPAAAHNMGAGSPEPDDPNDEFEIYTGGQIDLGEMVAQHLGVSIDPYPRKAGAALGVATFGAKTARPQPFAQLVALAEKPKSNPKNAK